MTWETPDERDALADNRTALWNGRTPLYESGELPMSKIKRYDIETDAWAQMKEIPDGIYMEFADHEADKQAALDAKDRQIAQCEQDIQTLRASLAQAQTDANEARKQTAVLSERRDAMQRRGEAAEQDWQAAEQQVKALTAQLSVEKNEHELAEKCADTHYQIVKALTAERDKMTDILMAAGFLGHGTQLIGDQRYKDLLDAETALAQAKERVGKLEGALMQIRDALSECCPRCEGNGRLYADGKSHYHSENAPTISCGNCGGSGRLQSLDTQDIATEALAAKPASPPDKDMSFEAHGYDYGGPTCAPKTPAESTPIKPAPREGDTVRYTGCDDNQARFGGCDDPRGLLTPGREFTVVVREVHAWHTRLILAEHPQYRFNSVCFEVVRAQSPAGTVWTEEDGVGKLTPAEGKEGDAMP